MNIKAIFPLFNYGGEPSVSKGIVSQLPSSHLLIHWVPAKLSNGVMPHGENSCQLQLLFLFDYLLTYLGITQHCFAVDALLCFLRWSCCWCIAFGRCILFRFLSRTLPDSRVFWFPARPWNSNTVCFLRIMPHLPVPLPDVGCLSAFSPDHNVCRSAGS